MTRKAIIADDIEEMRMLLRMGLIFAGWEVRYEAVNGADARTAWRAAEGDVDALVLDHTMPVLTGMDLAEEVRAEDPDLPILIVSAHLDDALRARAAALNVTCVDKFDAIRVGSYLPD